jgi:O-antigen ligase
VLFAAGLGLFAVLQFASGTQFIYGRFETVGNFFGPYPNPDHYSGLLEMLIPVSFFFIVERYRQFSLGAIVLLTLGVTVAIASHLLSGSRAGLLSISSEVVIAAIILRPLAHRTRRWSFVAACATILSAVLLFAWLDPGWVAHRLGSIVDVSGQSWSRAGEFRKTVALDSGRMFLHHPWLGVGLGNFEIAYPRYQTFPSDLRVEYAHNDYAQALAETGVVGAVSIAAALVLFFRATLWGAARRLGSAGGLMQMGAAIGCSGLLVHSFFDFNLHIPANAAWFSILAGMAIPVATRVQLKRQWPPLDT